MPVKSPEGIIGSEAARLTSKWEVLRMVLIGSAVLTLLVSDGLVRWTEERFELFDNPVTGWIDPTVRQFDAAMQWIGIGRVHPAIRAKVRDVEAARFEEK